MIGIVILNYLNWKDTIECIESLQEQTFTDFKLVVVDNFSNNDSVERIKLLQTKYSFDFVQLSRNLGFSNGNNAGINYLKKQYNIKNILVMNNDVLFTDKDYLYHLSEIKFENNVGAIGTKIIGSDSINQNPVYFPTGFNSAIKSLLINLMAFIPILVYMKKVFFKRWAKKVNDFSKPRQTNQNYYLHGSVIFLTENYLNKFDGFYGKTFLYYEEVILGNIFDKMNLRMVYYPEISIYHKEDQSSRLSFNNDDFQRRRYLISSIISSLPLFFYKNKKLIVNVNKSIKEALSGENIS